VDYQTFFKSRLSELRQAVDYRVIIALRRKRGNFPKANWTSGEDRKDVVNRCSNDYLGMGQHPRVIAAMHEANGLCGAGASGTRNVPGCIVISDSLNHASMNRCFRSRYFHQLLPRLLNLPSKHLVPVLIVQARVAPATFRRSNLEHTGLGLGVNRYCIYFHVDAALPRKKLVLNNARQLLVVEKQHRGIVDFLRTYVFRASKRRNGN